MLEILLQRSVIICVNTILLSVIPRVCVPDGGNLKQQPKHIVFLSQLLLLFQFCHWCKSTNPAIETYQTGTMVTMKTTCTNPKCTNKEQVWKSQPLMPGTRIPAANFLLSFGILMAGTSVTKVLRVFQHMGLAGIHLSAFFKHQKVSICKDC